MGTGYLQGRSVYVDKFLTGVAINYRPSGFIGAEIFPVVNVDKQSSIIPTYTQADLFRAENDKRSPGATANQIEIQVGSDSYIAKNYALRMSTTIEDRANAEGAWIAQVEQGRTMTIMDKLMLNWDVRVAATAFNTSNVGTSAAVGSAWTDYNNSDPWGDVLTQIDNVELGTGYRPNKVVFGNEAWKNFSRNDTVIDKIRQTGVAGGGLSAATGDVEALLQVDKVLVGNAFYNTAEEGITQSIQPIWTDSVLVYYAPERASVDRPSFGYSFRWNKRGIPNMTVERHPYNSLTKSDDIEIGYYQDEKITAAPLGALLTNVTSST